MEPKVTTSYSQVGFPVEGPGHQPIHKTLDQKFTLPTRSSGMKMEQRLKRPATKRTKINIPERFLLFQNLDIGLVVVAG